MKNIILLLLLTSLFSCSTVKSDWDYDSEADFTSYKTYSWVDMKGIETSYHFSSLNDKRVRGAIERRLTAKGLKKVESGMGDLDVNYLTKVNRKFDTSTFRSSFGYVPYAGHGSKAGGMGYGGMASFNTSVYSSSTEHKDGTLMIDLIDAKKHQLVWRGHATAVIKDRSTQLDGLKILGEAIEKILKNYPPEIK